MMDCIDTSSSSNSELLWSCLNEQDLVDAIKHEASKLDIKCEAEQWYAVHRFLIWIRGFGASE